MKQRTKVMVVEDELFVGVDLVMQIDDLGYQTSGPHRTPDAALRAIDADDPDVAVLDVNLGNGLTSLPVAEALAAAGKPFVFLTGYSKGRFGGSAAIENAAILKKPVSGTELASALTRLAASLNFRG